MRWTGIMQYFIFYSWLRSVIFNKSIQLIFDYVSCGFILASRHQNFKFYIIYIGRLHYLVRINNTVPFCILPVTQRCNTIIVIIIWYYNSDEWGWRISQRSLTHPTVSQSSRAANSTHHCAVNEFSLNHHKGKGFFIYFLYKHMNDTCKSECLHAF